MRDKSSISAAAEEEEEVVVGELAGGEASTVWRPCAEAALCGGQSPARLEQSQSSP